MKNTSESKLIEVVAGVLMIPISQIDEQTEMDNVPGWDSLKHMKLIAELENNYEITFQMVEIMNMRSVQTIIKTMHDKGVVAC